MKLKLLGLVCVIVTGDTRLLWKGRIETLGGARPGLSLAVKSVFLCQTSSQFWQKTAANPNIWGILRIFPNVTNFVIRKLNPGEAKEDTKLGTGDVYLSISVTTFVLDNYSNLFQD